MVLAEDLRQAVLQAALQGKLTEQLETDSNVDELLENIQVEKKKLIAEKKIKKEKPLPEIQEKDIPFDIPDSWRWVRWGNLAYSIQYGYNASAKESGRIKMVRISDIQDNSVDWDTVPYCDIEEEEIATYRLQKNDILFARTGGTVGKSFLVNNIQEDAIYAGYLIRTRYSNRLVPKYLKGFMESQLYWVQLQNGKTQGCQPNCNGQTLSKMLIPLPPMEEQQRIVDKINEIMPKIDEYEKIEKELEALKKEFPTNMKDALLQAAMQGKLTEQLESDSSVDELLEAIRKEKDELIAQRKLKKEKLLPDIEEEEIPFDIPENWRWVRLNEIGEIIGGGTPRTSQTEFWDNGDISWITPADMNGCGRYIKGGEKSITQLGLDSSSAKLFPKGSVVISSRAPIGYIAIVQNDASTSQGCKTFSAYIQELVLPEYIYYAIRFRVADMEKRATGTTFKEISGKGVGETIIPLPPAEEQQRIVERLDALLPLCEDLKEE